MSGELQHLDFMEVDPIVRRFFPILDSYVEFGIPTFILAPGAETKKPFLKLYWALREKNYIPVLRRVNGTLMIKVVPYTPRKRRSYIIFIILLIATLGTLIYSGWSQVSSSAFDIVDPRRNIVLNVFLYVACFMIIAGLHEMGHKIACEFHGVKSSPPYFIPGPMETGGTLGAVIIQESPVVNRDQLFDIGISGPILGFIAAIFVSILGLRLSYPTRYAIGIPIPSPLIFDYLVSLVVNLPPGYILLLHPVAFAGWIGFLLTFLNIMPIAQLDGGHIARAVFGAKYHRLISYIAAAALFLMGYYFMAILAIAMLAYRGHPGPLDDVSPLSRSRKILGLLLIPSILVLSATIWIIPL